MRFVLCHAACFSSSRRQYSCFILWDATTSSISISLCTCSRSAANSACMVVTSFSVNESFSKFSPDKNEVYTTHILEAPYPSGLLPLLGQRPLALELLLALSFSLSGPVSSPLFKQAIPGPQSNIFKVLLYRWKKPYKGWTPDSPNTNLSPM